MFYVIFVDTMLPCEFCEELFPEEDLILHQVWFNLSSGVVLLYPGLLYSLFQAKEGRPLKTSLR